jgi:membrane protein YdbS with pleckstrin-like domain
MFCNRCGEALPEGSRFCNYCGAPALGEKTAERGAGPMADRVAVPGRAAVARVAETEEEEPIFKLRPTMFYVIAWYIIAAIVWIAAAAATGIATSQGLIDGGIAPWIMIGAGLLVFSIPVYKHILRRREVYTLTNHKLEMRYGLISKTVRNIPLRNIQDVTVTASVWQRFLKLGDIVIDSASDMGRIHLNEIHHPEQYANIILGQLRRRN